MTDRPQLTIVPPAPPENPYRYTTVRDAAGHRLRDGRPPAHCQCPECRPQLDALTLWAIMTEPLFALGFVAGVFAVAILEVAFRV